MLTLGLCGAFFMKSIRYLFKGMLSRLCNHLKEYEGDGEGEAEGERELDEVTGCSQCSGAEWNDSTRVS